MLYEVVAEDTSEERTSERRRGSEQRKQPIEKPKLKHRQLEIIPSPSPYEEQPTATPKAAESPTKWGKI